MISVRKLLITSLVGLLLGGFLNAQQSASLPSTAVPRLVNFSGKAIDAKGKPITGATGITFVIYADQFEGAPLWMETQNVQVDAKGSYTVQLGATKPEGLPLDLFTSGAARWLGVTVNVSEEQPRILLLSVPYALKAADAETVGGLPPSAFVLAAPQSVNSAATSASPSAGASASTTPPASSDVTTSGGTVSALPLWTTGIDIESSIVSQTGSGTTARIGVNNAKPVSTLDVIGGVTVRGNLALPGIGVATAAAGRTSRPTTFTASSFNSATGAAVPQNFRWQAEPVGNDTATASGSLNLLYGAGTNPIAETGLHIDSNGQINFAPGQSFPGTVASVGLSAPSSDFTVAGSPVTSAGTLALNWLVAPTSLNSPSAIVKRDNNGNFNAGFITGVLGVQGEASCAGCVAVQGISLSGIAIIGRGTTGVEGYASVTGSGAAGVYGDLGSVSHTGSGHGSAGVWGDTGLTSIGEAAVLGTSDDSLSGDFENNSAEQYTLYAFNNNKTGAIFLAQNGSKAYCLINGEGDLDCSGTKNAVVPIDAGKRKVALSAIESPQNWFEDFGSAKLVNGVAVITLDPDFIQTVNTGIDYKVFPVPNDECRGLYVTHKTAISFEVRELGGGGSNVSFDYRITALRQHYETVRFADHTHETDLARRMIERKKTGASPAAPRSAKVMPQPVAAVPLAQLAGK